MQMATFRASGQGGTNPAPTVTGIAPSSGTTSWRHTVTITGSGICVWRFCEIGRNHRDERDGDEQQHNHRDYTGACRRYRGRCGHQLRQSKRYVSRWVHLHGFQSRANGDGGSAKFGYGEWRDRGNDYRHGVPVGSDGDIWAARSHGCDGGEQHHDHRDYAGAHSGSGDVVVTNTDGQSGTLTRGYTYTRRRPAEPLVLCR